MEFLKLQTFLNYILIVSIIFIFFPSCSKINSKQESLLESKLITLTSWQYLAGKLSDSSNAQSIPIQKLHSSNSWKSISSLDEIKQKYKGEIIWLRAKLPDRHFFDPAIYFGQINFSIQAYLNEKMIYEWGSFISTINKNIRWTQVLIPLYHYQQGDEIVFKIKLGPEFEGFNEKILYGSSLEIVKDIFNNNKFNFIFIVVSFLICLTVLLTYIFLARTKIFFGIILFLIPIGTFIFTNTLFFQLIFNIPIVFYHLNYISILASSIGLYFLTEQVVIDKFKRIINILWKISLTFIPLEIIIDNFTGIIFYEILKYLVIIDMIYAVIGLVTLFISVLHNKYESKIFILGIVGLYICIIIEFINFMHKGVQSDFGYNSDTLQIGVFLFVASIIWIAIHNYLETKRDKEMLQLKELEAIKLENEDRYQFMAKLIDMHEFERSRIAMELHDGIGQKLLIIKNQLLSRMKNSPDEKSYGSLKMLSDLAGETIQEVRNITYNLRPQNLDQLGLTSAIKTIVENISDGSDIKFNLNIDNIDEFFPKADEINLFRIIQESLNNIVKHSQATNACININRNDGELLMEISDNGIGMKQNNSAKTHLGLRGMKERAAIIGAKLDIDIKENSGTIIRLDYKKMKTF